MPRTRIKEYDYRFILSLLILPAVFIYYEMILGIMTLGTNFTSGLLHYILAGSFYGFLTTIPLLFMGKRARGIARIAFAFVVMIPYIVEYFIYKQFKTFYDLNTITNGGEGALTGFKDAIWELVKSKLGILAIVLFLIPVTTLIVLYILQVKRNIFSNNKREKSFEFDCLIKLTTILMAGLLFGVNLAVINMISSEKILYSSEYNFQNAVSKFGLMETLRIDINHMSRVASGELDFASVEAPSDFVLPTATPTPTPTPAPTVPGATPTPTPTPTPEPVPQVLDIPWDDIIENNSGTIQSLAEYCVDVEPSMTNEYTGLFAGKNLIMITAEAFTAEVIDPVLTPTLYRMATQGINFNDHYVQATAGTTGGEFSHLFGLLPTDGGSSVPHMTSRGNAVFNMGAMLNEQGYYGMAFHNNDYCFYSRNTTHNELGYSEGFMGWGNGMEEFVDPVWPESDRQMFEGTLPMYIDQQPFNVYYMTVSGHSNYSHGANAMAREHWEETASLEEVYSSTVRSYIACNLELESAMAYLIGELEEAGIADDTVIVINADHFPYGLDHDAAPGSMPYLSELYGYEVTNYMQRDHNRLIIWSGCLEDMDPIIVNEPTSSLDVLPTLLNLFGLEWDSRLFPGRDVFSDAMPLVFNLNYDWRTEYGTYISNRNEFYPSDPDFEVTDEYIQYIRSIVSNRITLCRGVLSSGFYGYIYETLYPSEEGEG